MLYLDLADKKDYSMKISIFKAYIMKAILIIFLLTNGLPVFSYQSGDTLIIKRKSKRSKPLLERKFIILRDKPKHQQISNFEQSELSTVNNKNNFSISELSQNLNKKKIIKPVILKQKAAKVKAKKIPMQTVKPQDKSTDDIYNEANWEEFADNSFATESLNVNAKLLNK